MERAAALGAAILVSATSGSGAKSGVGWGGAADPVLFPVELAGDAAEGLAIERAFTAGGLPTFVFGAFFGVAAIPVEVAASGPVPEVVAA